MGTKKTTRKLTKPSASAAKQRTPGKSKGTKTMAKKTSAKPARNTAKKAAGASTRKAAKKTTGKAAPQAAEKAAGKQPARATRKTASRKAAAKRKPATAKAAGRTRGAGVRAAAKPTAVLGARSKKKQASAAPIKKLTKRDLEKLREELLELRQHLTGQIDSLKLASLTRDDEVVSPEDGTDAFDRQFNLNLVRTEGEALFDIEEALRRIDEGTYGVCETCECTIPKARLEALPFVKNCVACQAEMEKGKSRFRPLPKGRARP